MTHLHDKKDKAIADMEEAEQILRTPKQLRRPEEDYDRFDKHLPKSGKR